MRRLPAEDRRFQNFKKQYAAMVDVVEIVEIIDVVEAKVAVTDG